MRAVSDGWAGLIVVALGAGIVWTARGAAEVNQEVLSRSPRRIPAFFTEPEPSALIGRAVGVVVIVAGILLGVGVFG